jgi:anti-sigma factor RsiW
MGVVTGHGRDDLLRYAEQRLDAASRARVEAHLARCAACRAEAATLVDLVDSLQAMPGALRAPAAVAARRWPAVWA